MVVPYRIYFGTDSKFRSFSFEVKRLEEEHWSAYISGRNSRGTGDGGRGTGDGEWADGEGEFAHDHIPFVSLHFLYTSFHPTLCYLSVINIAFSTTLFSLTLSSKADTVCKPLVIFNSETKPNGRNHRYLSIFATFCTDPSTGKRAGAGG